MTYDNSYNYITDVILSVQLLNVTSRKNQLVRIITWDVILASSTMAEADPSPLVSQYIEHFPRMT